MTYKNYLKKRNYFINLEIDTKNKRIVEIMYNKNKKEYSVDNMICSSLSETIQKYYKRINYLYNWGYNGVKEECKREEDKLVNIKLVN